MNQVIKIGRRGGIARARILSPERRSHIAKIAAKTRWARRGLGVLERSEIKRQVALMLADREAVAYLFGSYARGEAKPDSDIDLLVVEKKLQHPRIMETYLLSERLKLGKDVDLIVVDEKNYDTWKMEYGTVQHEVYRQGVRLV